MIHECHKRLPDDLSSIVDDFERFILNKADVIKGYCLEGNELIEQAISDAYRCRVRRAETIVKSTIYEQIQRSAELITPVDTEETEEGITYYFKSFVDRDGAEWIFAYTSMDQLRAAPRERTLALPIEDILRKVNGMENTSGLILNTFGQEYRILKDEIRVVLGERRLEEEREVMHESARIHDAIVFATKAHKGQVRKGTDIDYISHPLEVLQILTYMQADFNLQIAGVLHDTVEDTSVTLEQIRERYGEDVANLVGHHSEDKSKTWDERKTTAIEELEGADFRLKMLVMADKVSNLRSILADYQEQGEAIWSRFNAPKAKQAWYYSGIQDALAEMQNSNYTAEIYWEMVATFKDIFVKFYMSKDGQTLYQVSADGEAYMRNLEQPEWTIVESFSKDELSPVARQDAEKLEDLWDEQLSRS